MGLLEEFEGIDQSLASVVRHNIARKITSYMNSGFFVAAEIKMVHQIIRILAKDCQTSVRKIIAENLKNNLDIPHDVVLQFCDDITEVSSPILRYCSVLKEKDLLEIIKNTEQVAKLKVIAQRDDITANISAELIKKRYDEVVITLFTNQKAEIFDYDIKNVLTKYKDNQNFMQILIAKGDLQLSVAKNLVNYVSVELKYKLFGKYNIGMLEPLENSMLS